MSFPNVVDSGSTKRFSSGTHRRRFLPIRLMSTRVSGVREISDCGSVYERTTSLSLTNDFGTIKDRSRSKPPEPQKLTIEKSALLIGVVFSAYSPVGLPSESTTCTTELGITKGLRSL